MGDAATDEIPLLIMLFYLSCYVEASLRTDSRVKPFLRGNLRMKQRQVGSLAGAAHLLNDNTGVLRLAQ